MPFRLPTEGGWSSQQQLMLELIEKLPTGVVLWGLRESDLTLRLLGSNAAAIAITGLNVDLNFDLPMRVVFPHVTLEREAKYLHLVRTGESLDFGEIVTDGMPGAPRTIALRAFRLSPVVLVVVFEDRTDLRWESLERARIATELREKQALFRNLVEGGRDALVVLDAETKHLYATPSIRGIFGYTVEEFLAVQGISLVPEEDRPRLAEPMRRLLERPGAEFTSIVNALHKDGSVRRVELYVVNRLHEPEIGGLVCVLRDVTEQERNQEALRRAEQLLRQAQRVDSIGLLAGGVAHDFNNLLSVITGYVSIAIESLESNAPLVRHVPTSVSQDLSQDLSQALRASERAAELTRQLLAFSRHQVLAPDVVDLNEVVARMEKMLRRLIGEHIDLDTRTEHGLGKVVVDAGQMEQVIMNLSVNARDAMPEGGSLTLETASVFLDETDAREHIGLLPGPHVMLAVSDTGIGMTEATQSHIFEPFFTTKERGKGTGLGLSTVFGIVKQSGGSIRCHSEVGRGSRFEMFFPEAQGSARIGSPTLTVRSPSSDGAETILVVEDEAQLRSLARVILESSGYRVLDASDGNAALDLSASFAGTIDLLVTDVVLPGVNGVVVAERLRAQRAGLKVLYVSGYADNAIISQEGIAFLQKPITPERLRRKIREVLDG